MATASKNLNMKHRSKEITEGTHRAPARAMLWAMGLSQEDMDRPFVAIANLASDVTPCNVHLDRFAQGAKEGVRQAEGTPFEFGTITVSDGISMGTEGMKASLVSREVIADSIEVVAFRRAHGRLDNHCRLRQEHAGLHDGHGPSQYPLDIHLRRHHHAGPLP